LFKFLPKDIHKWSLKISQHNQDWCGSSTDMGLFSTSLYRIVKWRQPKIGEGVYNNLFPQMVPIFSWNRHPRVFDWKGQVLFHIESLVREFKSRKHKECTTELEGYRTAAKKTREGHNWFFFDYFLRRVGANTVARRLCEPSRWLKERLTCGRLCFQAI
jgi:hypothetical protein